jgi:hypothetical protein
MAEGSSRVRFRLLTMGSASASMAACHRGQQSVKEQRRTAPSGQAAGGWQGRALALPPRQLTNQQDDGLDALVSVASEVRLLLLKHFSCVAGGGRGGGE